MAEETVGGLSDWQRSFCTPEVPKGWSKSQGMGQNSGVQLNPYSPLLSKSVDTCLHRELKKLSVCVCASPKPHLTAAVFHKDLGPKLQGIGLL